MQEILKDEFDMEQEVELDSDAASFDSNNQKEITKKIKEKP